MRPRRQPSLSRGFPRTAAAWRAAEGRAWLRHLAPLGLAARGHLSGDRDVERPAARARDLNVTLLVESQGRSCRAGSGSLPSIPVAEGEVGELAAAAPGVEQHADDGVVAPVGELAALARVEQGADVVEVDPVGRLERDRRDVGAGERIGLAGLLGPPREEGAQVAPVDRHYGGGDAVAQRVDPTG